MKDYSEIIELILKFSHLGLKINKPTGALLIGRAPHIAELAWLNSIYSTIGKREIKKLETGIGKKIPAAYVDFLTNFSNGLKIISNVLTLDGYRENYIRSEEFIWQPYNLIEVNKYEKPGNSTEEMFFIGGYTWGNGSLLYMTPDEKVHFCQRDDATSLYTWDSLSSMLVSEIKRLYGLFDSKGVKIDKTQPTTPI